MRRGGRGWWMAGDLYRKFICWAVCSRAKPGRQSTRGTKGLLEMLAGELAGLSRTVWRRRDESSWPIDESFHEGWNRAWGRRNDATRSAMGAIDTVPPSPPTIKKRKTKTPPRTDCSGVREWFQSPPALGTGLCSASPSSSFAPLNMPNRTFGDTDQPRILHAFGAAVVKPRRGHGGALRPTSALTKGRRGCFRP